MQSNRQEETPKRQLDPATPAQHRWGIVLAGGDGVRLRELTEWVWGDHRPKQFCPILSERTLLEETRHRAERSVPPEQILYSVTRAHEEYYLPSLADRLSQIIVQPSNRGTAPAILSALMRIAHTDPNAMVVILPCDHYYSPESAFTATLESAFAIAEQRSRSVVLLGIEPKGPEVEYGWIEVGEMIRGRSGLFQVGALPGEAAAASSRSTLEERFSLEHVRDGRARVCVSGNRTGHGPGFASGFGILAGNDDR